MADSKFTWKDDIQSLNEDLLNQQLLSAGDSNGALEVSRHIRSLFMEQKYTDVKFVINSKSEPNPTFRAHKAILAVGSDTFKEMLYDNKSNGSYSEFLIKHIPYDAFKNVVEYLYTYEIVFENEVSAMEIWNAALKFKIDSLVDKCKHYVETSELTENNVCTKFQLATNHKLESLKKKCEEFIQRNTAAVLKSPDFQSVSMATVLSICKMEKLNLSSEIELFDGVLRWVKNQPDSENNKDLYIKSFLGDIRFLTLTCNEFYQFVQNQPCLLTAPEVSNILTHLFNPTQCTDLPSWCNKGTNRCAKNKPPVSIKPPNLQQFRRNVFPPDQYFSIPLKQSKKDQFFTDLKCVLEINNTKEIHVIKGISLAFEDPLPVNSLIKNLTIRVLRKNTKFNFEEHFTDIFNSKNFKVRFSKVVPIHQGQSVTIIAEANDIRNYKFLQFDDNPSLQESPFICSLTTEPKSGRFFFISNVIYRKAVSSG